MSFIYALISRDPDIVLCDYSDYTGNFMQIARVVLHKGIKQNAKFIIQYDKYKIQYINESTLTYLCLSEQDVNDNDAFAFLSEIKNEVLNNYSYEELSNFSTYQMTKGTDLLKKYLSYYNSHPVKTKAGDVINELAMAKDVLVENVEKLIERNSKMDIIVTKSNNLKDISVNVSSIADAIRRNESSRKNKYVIVACVLVGILIIMFIFLK